MLLDVLLGLVLVVAFCPVGLMRPSRFACVLPDASVVLAPASPIFPEPVLPLDPPDPLDVLVDFSAGGQTLVVAFCPVGLMRPSRFACVLPDASVVLAPASPIFPEPVLPLDPPDPPDPLDVLEDFSAGGLTLVVAFCPVGLMRPSRFACVLPDASVVLAPASPIFPEPVLPLDPPDPLDVLDDFSAGGLTLVVAFCPVGLMRPSRFACVLPDASVVLAPASPIFPLLVLPLD
ncbi:hypothetical protein RY831_16475 [Noviherbaspirillum sp. CPCC 100848]|uniref:Uncharacterized protein n=1 Tax=Noviherbaspirillum album TaxID=3080276 RepID=A0ABU6JAT1_9BURK|nr:hypothetical protein [Noviherbaspirillum sp. CPCC 100848]MEC4720761.1 hypothetical protein [Noviherbaspirillum sp. CPCC 100848]